MSSKWLLWKHLKFYTVWKTFLIAIWWACVELHWQIYSDFQWSVWERRNSQWMLFSVNNSSLFIPTSACSRSLRIHTCEPVSGGVFAWGFCIIYTFLMQLQLCSPLQEVIWAAAQILAIGQSSLSRKKLPLCPMFFWNIKLLRTERKKSRS